MIVSPKNFLPLAFAISSVVLATFSTRAETISLLPIADTTLIETAPDNNLSGATFFNAGTAGNGKRNRGLILFDVSSAIPAGSTITSAELTLDIVRQPASGRQNSAFSLRRMFQSWGEGTQVPVDPNSPGQGAPAKPGEATWSFRTVGGEAWPQPGGQSGVSFSTTISSTAFVTGLGEQVQFTSTPQLVADIQAWLNQPRSNFGWMLMTESEAVGKTARSFASRESDFGPTLTIEFTPATVPEPSIIALVSLFALCVIGARTFCPRVGVGWIEDCEGRSDGMNAFPISN
jgi:hypothetical protein